MNLDPSHLSDTLQSLREKLNAAPRPTFREIVSQLFELSYPVGLGIMGLIIFMHLYEWITGTETVHYTPLETLWGVVYSIPFVVGFFFLGATILYFAEDESILKQKKLIKRAKRFYLQVNKLIDQNKPYILYLYDFESGETLIQRKTLPVAGTDGVFYVSGNHRREVITRKLHRHIPFVFLNNDRELNTDYKGFTIFASNDNWYEYFCLLCDHAAYIILDYQLKFQSSTHIQLEIKHLIQLQRSHLIFVGKQEELDLLLTTYPGLQPLIRYQILLQSESTHSTVYSDIGKTYWKVNSQDEVFNKIKGEL